MQSIVRLRSFGSALMGDYNCWEERMILEYAYMCKCIDVCTCTGCV